MQLSTYIFDTTFPRPPQTSHIFKYVIFSSFFMFYFQASATTISNVHYHLSEVNSCIFKQAAYLAIDRKFVRIGNVGGRFFPPHSPLLPALPLWLSAWHLYPELHFPSSLRYTLSAIRHLLDRVQVAETTAPIQWELLLAVLQDGSRIRSFSHFQGYTWVSARTLAPTSLVCCHTCLYSLFCARQSVIPLK